MELGEVVAPPAGPPPPPPHPIGHLSVTSRAVANTPRSRVRLTIGVGERIRLTAHGETGTVSWTVAGASTLNPASGSRVTLRAHRRQETATVTATDSCGCTAEIVLEVVEPESVRMERAHGIWHDHGIPSVGMMTNIYIRPIGVSFENIRISEDDCTGRVTGYFRGTLLDGIHHAGHGAGNWVAVGAQVARKGSQVNGQDTAQSGHCHFGLPYAAGTFDWPIPWRFEVGGGGGEGFATVHQRFTITSAGDMTVSKSGAAAAAALNDPSSVC